MTSGTPACIRNVELLSITYDPRSNECRRVAFAAVLAGSEEHDFESTQRIRVGRAHVERLAAKTNGSGASARRKGGHLADRHAPLLQHAQDRFAHDAGRTDDGNIQLRH